MTIAVAGGVFYGVSFAEFLRSNITPEVMKSPPGFAWIVLSHVPFGILLALVVRWRGALTAAGGAVSGGTLGSSWPPVTTCRSTGRRTYGI